MTIGQLFRSGPAVRRAFTLFELLVVLIIIGTVLAILLPSLATTQRAAKKVSSLSMLNNLSAATSQFITDRRTPPGYFSAVEMGAQANSQPSGSGRGFGAIQNVMIDLSGGITTAMEDGIQIMKVGPASGSTVNIDLAQMGGTGSAAAKGAKAYFAPGSQFMVAQGSGQVFSGSLADNHNSLLPTLVDAFGQPVLAWSQDDRGQSVATWAALDSGTVAKYYWASNGCYLNSMSLGKMVTNQTGDPSYSRPSSLLGGGTGTFSADQIQSSLMALLGHPAFPGAAKQELLGGAFAGNKSPIPSVARGQVVYHSAGANGVYMGTKERGGSLALGTGALDPSAKYVGGVDPMPDFDDIVVAAGN